MKTRRQSWWRKEKSKRKDEQIGWPGPQMMLATRLMHNAEYFYTLLSKGYSCIAKMDAFWPSKSRRFYSSMSSALCSEGACYEHMLLVKSREDNQWIQLDDSLCLCNLWGNWGATCSDFSVKNHRASWYIWFFRQKFGLLRKSLYSSETLGRWPGVTFAT